MGARRSRPMGIYGTMALLMVTAVAVGSCGRDQTAQAATCFRDALAETTIPSVQGPVRSCPSAAAYETMQRGSGTRFWATCAHIDGHEYVCTVTGPATRSMFSDATAYMLPAGPYEVMYDGQRISYQPRGG